MMAGVAGIAAMASGLHLLIGFRTRPSERRHLAFGTMCALIAVWAFLGTALIGETDPATYETLARGRVRFGYGGGLAMVWFITWFGRVRGRAVPWLLSAAHVVLLVANEVLPHGLYFSGSPVLSQVPLDWGGLVTLADGPYSWGAYAGPGINFAVTLLGVWAAITLIRAGARRDGVALGIAIAIFWVGLQGLPTVLSSPFPSAEPAFLAFIVVMTLFMADEIVEARRVRSALTETRLRLSAIVESAPEAILLLEAATGRTQVANDRAVELLGVDPNAVESFWVPDSAPDVQEDGRPSEHVFRELLGSVRAGGRARVPWIVRDPAGADVSCQALFVRLPGEDPAMVRFSLLDLSQLESAHQFAMKLESQLRQAQKLEAVGRLTGGIAHDFNNLLTVIGSSLELLLDEADLSEEHRELLDLAIQASGRSTELTQGLLAFSRKQPLAPRRVDITTALHTVAALLERTLEASIRLEVEPPERSLAVRVDPAQLEACLVNLAINGADAMPEGGRLSIGASSVVVQTPSRDKGLGPGSYVRIRVEDEGHGMDAGTLARVFEPFFTTKPIGKGTGLGLSAAYGFATQSGGDLRIDSRVEIGTTVDVFLPAAAVEPTP